MSDNAFPTNNRELNYSGVSLRNFPYDAVRKDPGQVSDWTFYNKGAATLQRSDTSQALFLSIPTGGGVGTYRNRGIYKPLDLPSASSLWAFRYRVHDYLIGLLLSPGSTVDNTPLSGGGIRSTTNEILMWSFSEFEGIYKNIYLPGFTNPRIMTPGTYYGPYAGASLFGYAPSYPYNQIRFDGVNLNFEISMTGEDGSWITIDSIVSPLVSPIASYGFFVPNGNGIPVAQTLEIFSSELRIL